MEYSVMDMLGQERVPLRDVNSEGGLLDMDPPLRDIQEPASTPAALSRHWMLKATIAARKERQRAANEVPPMQHIAPDLKPTPGNPFLLPASGGGSPPSPFRRPMDWLKSADLDGSAIYPSLVVRSAPIKTKFATVQNREGYSTPMDRIACNYTPTAKSLSFADAQSMVGFKRQKLDLQAIAPVAPSAVDSQAFLCSWSRGPDHRPLVPKSTGHHLTGQRSDPVWLSAEETRACAREKRGMSESFSLEGLPKNSKYRQQGSNSSKWEEWDPMCQSTLSSAVTLVEPAGKPLMLPQIAANYALEVRQRLREGGRTAAGAGSLSQIMPMPSACTDGIYRRLGPFSQQLSSEMMQEARKLYEESIARAMVTYDFALQANATDMMEPQWFCASAEVRLPEWRILRQTGVPHSNVRHAAVACGQNLCTVETVMLELEKLWCEGIVCVDFSEASNAASDEASRIVEETPFCNVLFTDIIPGQVSASLPMTSAAFCSRIERRAHETRECLKDTWLSEASKIVERGIADLLATIAPCRVIPEDRKIQRVDDYVAQSPDAGISDVVLDAWLTADSNEDTVPGIEGGVCPRSAQSSMATLHAVRSPLEIRSFRRVQNILRAASALMSRQLRSSVERSLESLSTAFLSSLYPCYCGQTLLSLNLCLGGESGHPSSTANSGITFVDPSLAQLGVALDACIDQVVLASQRFPNVESALQIPDYMWEDMFDGCDRSAPFLCPAAVKLEDECVAAAKTRIKCSVDAMLREALEELISSFDKFVPLVNGELEQQVLRVLQDRKDESNSVSKGLKRLSQLSEHLHRLREEVNATAPDICHFSVFTIRCFEAKEALCARAEKLLALITDTIAEDNRAHMASISEKYQELANCLVMEPADSAELKALEDFFLRAMDTLAALLDEYQLNIHERLSFLLERGHKCSRDDLLLLHTVCNWPQNIKNFVARSSELQRSRKRDLEMVVEGQQEQLSREIQSIARRIEKIAEAGSLAVADVQACVSRISLLKDSIAAAEIEAEALAEQEELLDMVALHSGAQVEALKRSLAPLDRLWTSARAFTGSLHMWLDAPMTELDPEEAEHSVDEMLRTVQMVQRDIKAQLLQEETDISNSLNLSRDVASQLVSEILDFTATRIPLMQLVCTPGLHERHWLGIQAATGISLPFSPSISLRDVVDVGLHKHCHSIEEICAGARQEYQIEKVLDAMEAEWAPIQLQTKAYRSTGTYVLSSVEDIQQLLDDHLVKIQAIKGSHHAEPFAQRAGVWEVTLTGLQDILDNWLRVQNAWLYLEPIFSSDDIMRQMPVEGRLFKAVDSIWRENMSMLVTDPGALETARRPGLLSALECANEKLETIQKGLNAYLETKRLAFSRFFFLSNDELLEILAETKDPLRVQPHLRKCFDGIASLDFSETLDILGCRDASGESVPFLYDALQSEPINPLATGGNVEVWLGQVETMMRKAVARAIDDSVADRAASVRMEWVHRWQGQVVLVVNQIHWTGRVEDALSNGQSSSPLAVELQKELLETVELVRTDIPKSLRIALGAAVVMDVHNRDVTAALGEQNVKSVSDFDWLAQLRYYWRLGSHSAMSGNPGTISCQMINAEQLYCFEYLGNNGRLVITPLTDRCYRTLMGAMQLHLGGAPEGPAGTGKTETTKDLGKAVAIQCVVTNCSDGLDYLAMGKFFKGLASSGAWACFDEFNRIQLEVLSVVAQQVLSIQQAKIRGAKRFTFEGTELGLKPTCCPFITMNPGYAGRAELPDNLKVLFRTVAMMVPDYAMISEIILYSMGYMAAKAMAIKITSTYRLCSEQLSSQSHYDYGMRAVMAVLRAAGNLKRSEAHLPEEVLVLRSIMDVNMPKFLNFDVPLFNGIVSDLFPGVTVPDPDRDAMLHAFHESCACLELQATPYLWEKMVQIYDMMVVRHGFMVVGSPFAGKTSAWRALQSSLSALHSAHPEDMRWSKVSVSVMNPKSITMGQLYGQFDPTTHEWSDGVLAIQYRTAVKSEAPGRKWVLFDGPVDAIWIENMNTVLDDNKKLCLMSGEIIAMTDSMSMMFEPMDLLVASPATVSRCGMIYMEAEKLGWRPLLDSWIVRHASEGESASEKQSCHTSTSSLCFSQCEVQLLTELCDWLVEPCLAFLRKAMTELSPTVDSNLVQSLLNVFECILHTLPSGLRQAQDVECAFLVAVTWSLGSSAAAESQARWCTFVREYMADATCIPREWPGVANSLQVRQWSPPQLDAEGRKFSGAFSLPMPPGLAHSYWYSTTSRKWVLWDDVLPNPAEPLKPPPGGDVSDIIVPNVRTVQHGTLLVTLLSRDKNVLVCGPTGTGKSVYTAHCLSTLPDVRVLPLNFSAKTSASMAQEIICTGLDRRRKGVLGPPLGQRAVVFVDDLNMPEVETYGAQPPIELLRQVVDNGGWYGVKEVGMPWQQVVDVTLVAAMGPAGGGRNIVTPRLLRHFNLLCFQDFDDQTLTHIFTSIMEWKLAAEFSPQVQSAARTIVAATLDVYRSTMNVLRPTPSKSHYTFNLRDFSRVVQGVLMVAPHRCRSTDGLVRLWMHECLRVFSDRLVEDQDRIWFEQDLSRAVSHHFDGLSVGTLLRHLNEQEQEVSPEPRLTRLIFGDVCNSGESREYREMTDLGSLKLAMENVLEEYNSCSRKPMNLVLFSYAIEHICRIARILRMPGGNALLVGVGGSGRQSCAQLAVHVVDHAIFRIEISRSYGVNEWREDLKSVLTAAGTGPRPVVFFFSDVQIKDESFVEDLSNILNSGDVPNLFAADESANLCEAMRPHAKQLLGKAAGSLTSVQLREMFVARARRNLHVVLTFSPIGQAFRDRLRKFPSLVNCCAINWFTSWPEDALIAVASQHLQGIDLDQDEGGEHTRQALVRSCQTFHTDANVLSQVMSSTLRRTNYVTPTSYLELILAFKSSLSERRAKIRGARERYLAGLQKIAMATESVNKMQKELEEMQPILVQSAKDTEVLMAEISKKLPGVEAKRQEVSSDAAVTQASADECQLQKQSVEEDLAEALPALEMAIRALDTIKQSEINEVKILSKPPSGVKVVCEAVCVMLGIKPQRIPDPEDPSKRIMDFWGPSQKMLGDPDFINQLKTYDKDNIPPKTIAEIRKKYVTDPRFTPEAAEKASKAAAGLCKWVYAMETYERVSAVVGPKKEALLEAEAELARTMEGLHAKQAELKQVEDGLSALQSQYDAAVQKKQDLEDQAANTSIQIERATTLIAGLGGERERWEEFAVRLGTQYACSTGDVLVSAGVMAYLGPFTAMLRQRQVSTWVSSCKASGIPCSESPTLSGTLGEPLKIRQWNIDGLPTDSFSVDNAIIIFSARRWPLMIDPQGQANQWIRRMESENKLGILKLSDSDYMRTLENAIQFGTPVLLENVGEGLDPTLEPLLLKQIFKQGGVDSIRLGDATVEYSPDFRFYMTTKLRNPHYLPEVSVKVTLINFMITPEGLQDQLLGVTVQKERPDLEEQRNRLIVESSANKAALIDIEDRILRILSSSEGNILEDATAIDTLSQSKVLSDEINAKQEIAERTERSIDEVRREYQPIAHTSQVLFFAVSDLASVEPVYQYSLGWFVRLYESSIANSETSSDIPTRLRTLEAHFMLALYVAVCRSLLEKDKLLFSFLLVARIMEGAGELDEAEWLFLLTGSTPHGGPAAINPCPEWLLERAWDGMRQLSGLPSMSDRGRDLKETFVSPEGAQQWRRVYDSAEPHVSPLPYKGLTAMQRLCVLRCLRPDMMTPAIRQFVKERAGEEFVTPPAFDLETCFAESSAFTPLIFILSPGSDPMTAILRTAEKCGMQVSYISLGQGQGPLAEQMIGEAAHRGSWVVLQNCHLAPSWMMTLEKIVERLSSSHSDFRLWCTTYPSKDFPASVLQNGIKMTIEPPKGVRANLRGSFEGTMDLVEEGSPNEVLLRRLLFGLCFFHALVQERRLYGPIGWNIPYEFNESDLRISAQQLAMFVGAAHGAGDVPYEALIYTAGECNYGGRVTDDKDRRVLLSILSRFYCESATQEGYGLSSSGDYVVPQDSGTSACYIEHVDRMPPSAAPEVFGLHSNANISRAQKETANLFGNMLLMQGTSGGQVQDKDAMTAALAADIQARLPQPFDMEIAQLKYPVVRNESMNTVLCQELQRFNSLLGLIRNSLHEMQNAIKGLVVMSADLEILGTQLFFNRIPDMWKAASYPSLKPLSSYVSDLLERVEFFDRWLQHGQPSAFWICGFFFTQAFLTGALQNYARRHTVPIDAVTFSHEMLAQDLGDVSAPPQDGIYAHGLFLEGARWDRARGVLGESSPKVLFSSAPVVWFRPTKSAEETGGTRISYECPVYKTSDRRGILSTTGHSTNFICFVSVPSDTPGSHWIQRGVCMLTTLDD